jgi:hypothetical protein
VKRESGQQPACRVDVAVQGAVGHGGVEGDVAGEPALAQSPHGGDQLAGQDDLERFRRGEGGAGRLGGEARVVLGSEGEHAGAEGDGHGQLA